MIAPDVVPLWFGIPAAVILNAYVIRLAVVWHRGRLAEIHAEHEAQP